MNGMSKVISQALSEGRKHLAENEVKQLMKDEGVTTTDFQFVHKVSELAMDTLRFPCALKVCSPNILHKTDVGGVLLNIESKDALKRSFEAMSKKFPREGFLVEPMYDAPVEIIIGLINDASFGLTIMFGIGGIFTEIYKDVTFRVVPIKRDDAEEMISEIKAAPILEGFRKIKVDREGVIDLLMRISDLGVKYGKNIDQMDLNPVFVSTEGVRVIDAKMILR